MSLKYTLICVWRIKQLILFSHFSHKKIDESRYISKLSYEISFRKNLSVVKKEAEYFSETLDNA